MEKNKILLIIVSVTLFLAAVLSIGLWFFYPRAKDKAAPQASATNKTSNFDPIEWVRTKEEYPALSAKPGDEKKEDVIIVYGEDKNKKPIEQVTTQQAASTNQSKASETKTKVTEPIKPVATAPAKAETPKPKTPVKPKTITVREYLIQVGSFSTRDRAEQAGQVLKEKGLAGQIVSKDLDGIPHYRLRVGPYSNKAEAEKFLTWIRQIQGFENSIIFEGTGTKTVAN
jgi:cell division protein FtsN